MRLFLCLFVVTSFWAFHAHAQIEQKVSSFCTRIERHVPDANVNYVSGGDVNGNSVVEVDLGSVDMPTVDPVVIPIEIDLQDYFDLSGVAANEEGLDLKPSVANLQVYNDGRVLYNGQDVSKRVLYGCESGESLPSQPSVSGTTVTNFSNAQPVQLVPEKNVPEKNEVPVQNVIDVEPLNAQDSTNDDNVDGTLIEGQYP